MLVLFRLGSLLARKSVGAAIGLVGGGVLLYMAYGMVSFAFAGGSVDLEGGSTALMASPILAGILISLANPYWSVWWATIGLKYIALSRDRGKLGVAAFCVGHILSDVAWYLAIAGGVALGRRAISPTVYRWTIGACGLVLVVFGVGFIVAAIRYFAGKKKAALTEENASAACDVQ